MGEPKEATEAVGCSELNIFLFNNGQEDSPPRKYYLRAEQLDWWEATISYLTQAHFGSLCSPMSLYTLDGKIVEGPQDLKDGCAYVAARKSENFLPAGYETYLLKASKSWEKSQAKKSSAEIMKQDGKLQENQAKKTIRHNTEKLKSDNKNSNKWESHAGHKTENVKKVFNKSIISTIRRPLSGKQSDKKPLAGGNGTLLKTTDTIKTVNTSNTTKTLPEKSNVSKIPRKLTPFYKKGEKLSFNVTEKHTADSITPKLQNVHSPLVNQAESEITDQKKVPVRSTQISNLEHNSEDLGQEQVNILIMDLMLGQNITSINQNTENDKKPAVMDTFENFVEHEETNINKLRNGSSNEDIYHDHKPLLAAAETSTGIENKEGVVPDPQLITNDKNKLIAIKNGEVTNRYVDISLRNGHSYVMTSGQNTEKTQSLSSVTADKVSQVNIGVNIDQPSNKVNTINMHKSLQSVIQAIENDAKKEAAFPQIVVIKCMCCDHTVCKELCIEHINQYTNKKNISIMSPQPNIGRNESQERFIQASLPEIPPHNVIYTETVAKEPAMDVVTKTESSHISLLQIYSKGSTVEHQIVSQVDSKRSMLRSEDRKKPTEDTISATSEIRKIVYSSYTKYVVSRGTQTNLCNLILNARLQRDGMFKLEFPPLHTLKAYNFL